MSFPVRFLAIGLVSCALAATSTAQDPREQAWSTLKDGLTNKSAEKRAKAVGELGLLQNDPQGLDAALTALKDEKPEVRAAAAQALGEMDAKSAKPQLVNAINDPDVTVILSAAHSLVLMNDEQGYNVFYAVLTGERKSGESLMEQQKKMLNDPKKLAGLGFQTGLGFVPFGSMGLSAYKIFTKDDTSPVLAAAALTLAKDPDPKSGEALANAASPLQQKKWLVRAAAYEAIAKRGDPSLKATAVSGLQDPQEEAQYAAAAAVIHLSDIEAGHKKASKPTQRHTTPKKQ